MNQNTTTLLQNKLPLSVIQVTGIDAAQFLQQQLTQDVLQLEQNQARAFCYCQHQGKVIANGLILKNPTGNNSNNDADIHHTFLLIVEQSIAELLIKKISMYILRAKVEINMLDLGVYASIDNNISATYVNFEFLNIFYSIQSNQINQDVIESENHEFSILSSHDWQIKQLRLKFPWINQNTRERFTPHMLELNELGVNFQKGCYPGQEVVARTQYLGKNKKELKIIEIKSEDAYFNDLILESHDFVKKSFAQWVTENSELKSLQSQQSLQSLTSYLLLKKNPENEISNPSHNLNPIGDILHALLLEDDHYLIMVCGAKE